MSRRLLTLSLAQAVVLVVSATPWSTPAQTSPAIKVEKAWARRADRAPLAPGASATSWNSAVYMTLTNPGAADDAVVSATSDAARLVELHEMTQEGVMSMRRVPKLIVPAGGQLEMKPGGSHVMLLGLTRDLKPGDTVKVTLMLEKAGAIAVTAHMQ